MNLGQSKIFGIGLSKTGTSSLAQALQRLGFKTKDYMGIDRYASGDLSSIDMATVLANDALTDTPIPSFYRELDRRFPGSRFILTVRDRDGWLKSCRKQFNERHAAKHNPAHKRLFEDLFGTDVFDEQRFLAGYERFVGGVYEYFKTRPQDLLIMNIAAGDGWEKLCPFLGRPVPDSPFPKANVTQITWINIDDVVALAEAAGLELLKRYKGTVATKSSLGTLRYLPPTRLLDRALDLVLGRDAVEASVKAAQKTISSKLATLGDAIPILSPSTAAVPYGERKSWNHVWLVDPLDGETAFARGISDFTVNIALVEDGKPILGVVHAPALGVTYFGHFGKGAFKRSATGETVSLPAHTSIALAGQPHNPAASEATSGSRSLAMCRLVGAQPSEIPAFGPAMEWKVAAAQLVLHLAGMETLDRGSEGAPSYNSSELKVGPLTIATKQLA